MATKALEERSLKNFDDLRADGKLFWKPTEPEIFEFRVPRAYDTKPILSKEEQEKPKDSAFADDDPRFCIETIDRTHRLILNKFCAVRPQFVLHTIDFEPQSQALSNSDIDALWRSLTGLGAAKYMGIFNCGAEAGSSVGHKHMQVLPHSEGALFPDAILVDEGTEPRRSSHPDVPFQHSFQRLDQGSSSERIFSAYQDLCGHLRLSSGSPHNVVLTERWILVVPRSKARVENMPTNAAGMLGIVWVHSEEILAKWKVYGPMKVLTELGVPR